jgi:hypothetical protein
MRSREKREKRSNARLAKNVATVLDALGGDADRNVVEHRFQELGGGGELARQLALVGAILMRRDRSAIGQIKTLDQHRLAIGQSGDQSLCAGGAGIELLHAHIEQVPLAPHLEQFRSGHALGHVGARQAINFKIAVIEEHDPLLRIGHHHALVQMV